MLNVYIEHRIALGSRKVLRQLFLHAQQLAMGFRIDPGKQCRSVLLLSCSHLVTWECPALWWTYTLPSIPVAIIRDYISHFGRIISCTTFLEDALHSVKVFLRFHQKFVHPLMRRHLSFERVITGTFPSWILSSFFNSSRELLFRQNFFNLWPEIQSRLRTMSSFQRVVPDFEKCVDLSMLISP